MAKDARPRWRVNALSFIGHSLAQEGDEVFYTPPPGGGVGENLSPLNDEAQAIVDAQIRDHRDKTENRGKREAEEREAAEASHAPDDKAADDGLVPRPQGDKRSDPETTPEPAGKASGKAHPAAKAKPTSDDEFA